MAEKNHSLFPRQSQVSGQDKFPQTPGRKAFLAKREQEREREARLALMLRETPLAVANDQVVASSLDVAARFGKRHKNVLRAIQTLITDCQENLTGLNFQPSENLTETNFGLCADFTGLNFEPSDYTDHTGRVLPCYNLTRDGFSLLVMGFTGKEALRWKIKYIEAFNAMERELLNDWKRPYRLAAAGALSVMFSREKPERRQLIQHVMYQRHSVGYPVSLIAQIHRVSVHAVRRILRRYAPFSKDFLELLGLGIYAPKLGFAQGASHE